MPAQGDIPGAGGTLGEVTDDQIREALRAAAIPPLLPAIAHLTGDLSVLREELRPDPLLVSMPQGGLTETQQEAARSLALDALTRFRDAGGVPAPAPPPDDLLRILEHTVGGGGQMAAYLPLLEEELAYRGEDRRAPDWTLQDAAPGRTFRVVVIGAGMSGLLAGHRLRQAGIEFVIVDKNAEVGGTWWENTYPGCRVDNPNHNYSYSFAQRHDWPYHYSTQDVLRDYFCEFADSSGLRPHIRVGVDVESARWSDDQHRWTLTCRTVGGDTEFLDADAVISAVGQLNRPNFPDIAGRHSFAGPSFHSARWDHDVDLTGKKVAVIGTGASAVQFIPEIAAEVAELHVFQRTPPWLAPTADYHDTVAPGLRWLYEHVPSYSEMNRFLIFWRMGDGVLDGVRVDPDWPQHTASVSEINEMGRLLLVDYLETEFADRPDLVEHVVPDYPPGAKRGLRDNGVWARTLKRDNVHLVADRIREISPRGVTVTDPDGHDRQIDVDVIIYGTGFQASKFLTPMQVTGRGGLDLHEHWQGDARAYLGITIPGFPNLFCLYGPNTNIVVNGSIIYFSECGVRHILGLLELLLERGARSLEVRPDVYDAFVERVDEENAKMAWGASSVNSWYKNEHGHVAQNWPFTLLEYWERTKDVDPAEYALEI